MHRVVLLFVMVALSWPLSSFAHGGGLDSSGGHMNRTTGVYHCHRPPCGEAEPEAKAKSVTRKKGARNKWIRTGPAWSMPQTRPKYRPPESLVLIDAAGQPWLLYKKILNGPQGQTCHMVDRRWDCSEYK